MGSRGGRKEFHFYNESGELENIIKFLEDVQKKVSFINLTCTVDGNFIKITIFGPRDIQSLATERLKDLATLHLES
jgi:hypothetical protein